MHFDHSSEILQLTKHIIRTRPQKLPVMVNKHTDWGSFKSDLEKLIELNVVLKKSNDIELDLIKFIINIQEAATKTHLAFY